MEILDCLKKTVDSGQKTAILGIGSILRSDDGAGMYFIDLLCEKLRMELCSGIAQKDNLLLIAGSSAPENFTGVIKDFAPDRLIMIDAAHLGLLPGETQMVQACDISGVSFSTHMLPLSVMLRYLESEAGCEVTFIGIQPECTDQGLEMCGQVKEGTEKLAEACCDILK